MSNIMTKEDVKIIQFYQMPKVFFGVSKYAAMKNESKLAYMLLQDLLPLSIENNWVNKKGEVFVKLSRTKLMSLLNIKGTQKIAQVMKELVEIGLIIYKQVGLSKCNEIYICRPFIDEPVDKKEALEPTNTKKCEINSSCDDNINPPEISNSNTSPCETQTHIKTNSIKINYNKTNTNQSINPDDETDLEGLYERFGDQLHLDHLVQYYDSGMVEEIVINICDMYMNKTTHIKGQDMPRAVVRGVIDKLKMHHIEHVMDQFLNASAQYEIRHTKRYLQTLIYNSVFEASSKIRGRVRHDMGY